MPPTPSDPIKDSGNPIPNTSIDAAILVTGLRRLLLAWRERALVVPDRESHVYRQVENDVAAVISSHTDTRSVWAAAREDLVRALTVALDEREGRR